MLYKVKAKERHLLHKNHKILRVTHRRLKCPNIAHWMCSLAAVDFLKASTRLVNAHSVTHEMFTDPQTMTLLN